jgi:CheY-like chemotaxis protein
LVNPTLPDTDAPAMVREKEYIILIVEDNEDLRKFLVSKLQTDYEILEADNGQCALNLAFECVPELILCDLVIPVKDGMVLTQILKQDIRTSHIPIIILTARPIWTSKLRG